jgi:hypothetical protein
MQRCVSGLAIGNAKPTWSGSESVVVVCWRFVHALSSQFDVSDGWYLHALL